jgi:hypothetical protein
MVARARNVRTDAGASNAMVPPISVQTGVGSSGSDRARAVSCSRLCLRSR